MFAPPELWQSVKSAPVPERPVQPTKYRRNGGQSRHAMGCMELPLLHPAAICCVKRSVSKLIGPGHFNAKLAEILQDVGI
jgi:hypothetical protein